VIQVECPDVRVAAFLTAIAGPTGRSESGLSIVLAQISVGSGVEPPAYYELSVLEIRLGPLEPISREIVGAAALVEVPEGGTEGTLALGGGRSHSAI